MRRLRASSAGPKGFGYSIWSAACYVTGNGAHGPSADQVKSALDNFVKDMGHGPDARFSRSY